MKKSILTFETFTKFSFADSLENPILMFYTEYHNYSWNQIYLSWSIFKFLCSTVFVKNIDVHLFCLSAWSNDIFELVALVKTVRVDK